MIKVNKTYDDLHLFRLLYCSSLITSQVMLRNYDGGVTFRVSRKLIH